MDSEESEGHAEDANLMSDHSTLGDCIERIQQLNQIPENVVESTQSEMQPEGITPTINSTEDIEVQEVDSNHHELLIQEDENRYMDHIQIPDERIVDNNEALDAENIEDDTVNEDEQIVPNVQQSGPQVLNAIEPEASNAIVRMEDDFNDLDDDSSYSSSENSQQDEANQRFQRGNFHLPVNRVNEAIRRLIARDDSSGATVADLFDQDTFMQRLRRLLFSLDHDRQRNRLYHNEETPESNVSGNLDEGSSGEQRNSQSLDGNIEHANESEIFVDDNNRTRSFYDEEESINSVRFDTNLAAEHSYLGNNMNRVSGVNYLEEGQHYNLLLFMHQHILFPGEILPFMISEAIVETDIDTQNGLLFGICFPFLTTPGADSVDTINGTGVNERDDTIYGITCQIYEKGNDVRGNILIKSRALQRFVTKASGFTSPPQFITGHPQSKSYGLVKILPEIYLQEPLKCIDMGAMSRFRDIASMQDMYKRFQASTTPWPAHIYEYYSITKIIEKARRQLAQHKIDTMPSDPVQLSFWLVRNLHLSENMIKSIFMTDCVNKRMKMIGSTFKQDAMFTCRYCGNRIANCCELFAMSKDGVQTQYCNSAGYIHETNTVYQLLQDAILYSGQPSTEFSWFPGYQWHIIVCKICSRHIGWEFKAIDQNLVPKLFYGISSSSVRISTHASNPRDVIFQNFMRLVRREMQ